MAWNCRELSISRHQAALPSQLYDHHLRSTSKQLGGEFSCRLDRFAFDFVPIQHTGGFCLIWNQNSPQRKFFARYRSRRSRIENAEHPSLACDAQSRHGRLDRNLELAEQDVTSF